MANENASSSGSVSASLIRSYESQEEDKSSQTESSDDWDFRTSRSRSSTMDSLSQMSRQRSSSNDESNLDISFLSLDDQMCVANLTNFSFESVQSINLSGNLLTSIPLNLINFKQLRMLDISHNQIVSISDDICQLENLKTLVAANNVLDENSLPKDFGTFFATKLFVLSLGGNQFKAIPPQILELTSLRSLYLGDNQIESVPKEIYRIESLRVLYLGGNKIESIPSEMGRLTHLEMLSLCENNLVCLPSSIAQLRNLQSLALHRNNLTTLPPEIVKLRGLVELSLRNNPLVVRFIKDMLYDPPSLLELAARSIKVNKLQFNEDEMPLSMQSYLSTAHRCVNPKCKGVFFDSRVEHIKFVDFCGSYRLPLLQYLCSPRCSSQTPAINRSSSSDDESDGNMEVPEFKLRRVLLG